MYYTHIDFVARRAANRAANDAFNADLRSARRNLAAARADNAIARDRANRRGVDRLAMSIDRLAAALYR